MENISTTAFARDYHMDGHLATEDGKILGQIDVADRRFDACADPTKFQLVIHIVLAVTTFSRPLQLKVLHGLGELLTVVLSDHRGGLPD